MLCGVFVFSEIVGARGQLVFQGLFLALIFGGGFAFLGITSEKCGRQQQATTHRQCTTQHKPAWLGVFFHLVLELFPVA